jgi:hypothetical protein
MTAPFERQCFMAGQELELFVHVQGAKPQVVVASSGDTLRDVLTRAGVIKEGQHDILVFVGESGEALGEADDVEDGADQQAPVDLSLTLEKLDVGKHRHVHIHRCRHVAVEVNFGGKTKRRKFAPAATIGVVTQWARKKLDLDPAAAAEYVLRLCNSTEHPRADVPLGDLVQAPKCSICFDLVKEVTPQG